MNGRFEIGWKLLWLFGSESGFSRCFKRRNDSSGKRRVNDVCNENF